MYYDVPEGLGLRKIAAATQSAGSRLAFTPEQRRRLVSGATLSGVLGGLPSRGYGVHELAHSWNHTGASQQRHNNTAPASGTAPANQRPAGYGVTPKPAPAAWEQKIKDFRNGLAGPVNAPIEFRRHMYQQVQSIFNSPFAQRYIDRMRSGSK